jgi:hypothetical protein
LGNPLALFDRIFRWAAFRFQKDNKTTIWETKNSLQLQSLKNL